MSLTFASQFKTALFDPNASVPAGLTDNCGHAVGRRFDVYRNNVVVSLTAALRTGFPALFALLGESVFLNMARAFICAHPPETPVLITYGDRLPDFLNQFKQLKNISYLSDVARLELALRTSYHAQDATEFDPTPLGNLPARDLQDVRLTLAPSVVWVASAWPIFDIWRFALDNTAPRPTAKAQAVLVTRALFDPEPRLTGFSDIIWLESMAAGATLGAAVDAARACDASFDLGPLLGHLFQQNAFNGLTRPEDKRDDSTDPPLPLCL